MLSSLPRRLPTARTLDGGAGGNARRRAVVLTSDHGEEFLDHGALGHGGPRLYAELVRVPLIVWCPSRFGGGRVVDETVSLVDIVPTVLEIAGVPAPENLQGRSLVSVLAGGSAPTGRVVLSHAQLPRRPGFALALTGDRYKLIESRVSGEQRQVFDLDADPEERTNLASTRPDLLELFEPLLQAALAQHDSLSAAPSPAAVKIDPSLQERLRALGYDP